MKKKYPILFFLLAIVIGMPQPLISEQEQQAPVCKHCCERHEGRIKIAAILTGIAELARSFAVIFANPNDKQLCNEAVCGIVSGVCLLAAQATRHDRSTLSSDEIYGLMNDPAVFEKIQQIIESEFEAVQQSENLIRSFKLTAKRSN